MNSQRQQQAPNNLQLGLQHRAKRSHSTAHRTADITHSTGQEVAVLLTKDDDCFVRSADSSLSAEQYRRTLDLKIFHNYQYPFTFTNIITCEIIQILFRLLFQRKKTAKCLCVC